MEQMMRATLRTLTLCLLIAFAPEFAGAQYQPDTQYQQPQYQPDTQYQQPQYQPDAQYQQPQYQPPPPLAPPQRSNTFTSGELVRGGHKFFGTVSSGLAHVVETAVSRWGQPNGYVLGQEGGGAFIVGLRYGDGGLYTKNSGDRRVFWEGPSAGFDVGGDGARTMMLVYNLPATETIYQRFAGIDGSAYFIGGFGMTALNSGNIIVVPIRSGLGFRLGANIGYLKFTPQATWNPF
jgi:hypothetical protein